MNSRRWSQLLAFSPRGVCCYCATLISLWQIGPLSIIKQMPILPGALSCPLAHVHVHVHVPSALPTHFQSLRSTHLRIVWLFSTVFPIYATQYCSTLLLPSTCAIPRIHPFAHSQEIYRYCWAEEYWQIRYRFPGCHFHINYGIGIAELKTKTY